MPSHEELLLDAYLMCQGALDSPLTPPIQQWMTAGSLCKRSCWMVGSSCRSLLGVRCKHWQRNCEMRQVLVEAMRMMLRCLHVWKGLNCKLRIRCTHPCTHFSAKWASLTACSRHTT